MGTSKVGAAKDESLRWKAAHRLGDKPGWDDRCGSDWRKFPDRAPMRTLSEFQSTRVEPNFRSQTLPKCYKDTIFVPTVDKFKVNPKDFLSVKDKAKVVSKEAGGNPGGALSRSEFATIDDKTCIHSKAWNNSTELDKARANLHKNKEYDDMRLVNASKHITSHHYRNPMQSTSKMLRAVRKVKDHDRQVRKQQDEENTRPPRVFKISNRHEWQGALPPLGERNVSADLDGGDRAETGATDPQGEGGLDESKMGHPAAG